MKVSTKLNTKINNLSTRVVNFSKKLDEVGDSVKDLDKIIAEGDKANKDAEKFTRRAVAKFNRTKTFCKNFSDEAELVAETAEELAKDQKAEATSAEESANTPEDKKTVTVESEKFCRKMRIISKRFSEIAENLNNITSEAEAVVNMKPEDVVESTPSEVTSEPKSTVPTGSETPEGGEVTEQPKDVQTPAESVNFSLKNYYNFAIKSITKSFAEVVDNVEDAKDVVKDVSEEVTQEPEVPAETSENVKTPPTAEAPTEEVKPAEETPKVDETPTESKEFTEAEEKVIEEGKAAIVEGNFEAAENLENKLNELESESEGSGEKVLKELENFSSAYKVVKNFSSTKLMNVCDQVKQFAAEACESVIKKNIDAADLGAKAENLEKNQPGAGDLLTTVIECFGKIINSLPKVPNATECPVTAPEFNPKNFCGDIEAFVDNIKVEDKRFARDVKAKCFALENAIEDEDKDAVKASTKELAETLDKSDVAEIKDFGEKLVKFAEEMAASEKPEETETPKDEGNAVPEQVAEADSELNKVLDKLDEKGEQLKPEIATFAKKLCSAYKSMKCFTEEDLVRKLQSVEDLKKSFEETPATESTKPVEEPKAPEAPKSEETPASLVEEPNKESSELPSDSSLLNFTTKIPSAKDDPFGHFAALDIR